MLGWLLVPPHSTGGVCLINARTTIHATSLPSPQTTPWESIHWRIKSVQAVASAAGAGMPSSHRGTDLCNEATTF